MRNLQDTPSARNNNQRPYRFNNRRVRDAVSMDYQFHPVNRDDPTKMHWLKVLGENISANYPAQDQVPTIRFKRIEHLKQEAYMFKQSINRVRITLVPHEETQTVDVLVYDLQVPNSAGFYKPRYSHTPSFQDSFNYMSQSRQLVEFCLNHLSKDTPYSTDEYKRIQVTYDVGAVKDDVFYAGEISRVFLHPDGHWEITTMDNTTLELDADTFSGPRPAPGYYLIYKTKHQAETIPESDLKRFYEFIY